jgi:hypothetical protein
MLFDIFRIYHLQEGDKDYNFSYHKYAEETVH